jgi:hypothetical protein
MLRVTFIHGIAYKPAAEKLREIWNQTSERNYWGAWEISE